MKKDIFNHKQRYLNWKEKHLNSDIDGVSKKNSDLIKKYVFDMENGINISIKSAKGSRSYPRLNNIRQRFIFLAKEFEQRLKVDLEDLEEEHIFKYFNGMRNGEIKRKDGKQYQSTADYVKVFKAFWHWYMKVGKKNGAEIQDITTDLDTSSSKPKWVYLSEEQVKKLCDNAKYEYRILMTFLYDTGIRSPSELVNVKVSDIYNNYKEVHIREEISKTFGRRIKLMLSSELIKGYVKEKGLKQEDFLFPINYTTTNRYLQRLANKLFGDAVSEAGKKYSEITMYDFRHCACCYWLPRYKSESALKYRFGWKKSDKIHYYSELLGMKDTIAEEDILIDTTKTEIERRLVKTEKENTILKDKVTLMEIKMEKIQKLTDTLFEQINNPVQGLGHSIPPIAKKEKNTNRIVG